jgi:hypothetical protein
MTAIGRRITEGRALRDRRRGAPPSRPCILLPVSQLLTLTESQSKLNYLTLDRAALEWELVSHSFLSGGLELFL